MLPGISGHLVSEQFLETQLPTNSEAEERCPESVRLALGRWKRQLHWLGPASSIQTIFEAAALPLFHTLGFEFPDRVERIGSCIVATVRAAPEPVILVSTAWGERLDPYWRPAVEESVRRRAGWSFLFNGTHLRLVDTERSYSRRFVELDLELVFDDPRARSIVWTMLNADAFAAGPQIERSPIRLLVEQSERYATGVSRSLRQGVLAASASLLGALARPPERQPQAALSDAFEQSLTIVYRLLFLLFAEARGLVPVWHPVYRSSYSIESLRAMVERRHSSRGLWAALQSIARLAHAGCRAGDLQVTAFNGRLFAPGRTPLAERRDLDDDAAERAIVALSTRPAADRAGREPISYRDLGVEQLGSVYETLLDYEPRGVEAGVSSEQQPGGARQSRAREPLDTPRTNAKESTRKPLTVALVQGSGVRKATGSFYTPQPLADYLVRRTLGPLAQEAAPEKILQLRVLDPAMGSGAFLVAACRFLAEAYEAALHRAGGFAASDFGETERVNIRRTIAERCLYGVDSNPMAVQLARLSLWLATLAADKPLTFLDHHLQTGDSLLGAWISCLRDPPGSRAGSRKSSGGTMPLFDEDSVGDALRVALPVRFNLAGGSRRHDRRGPRQGTRARLAQSARVDPLEMETGGRPLVLALVRRERQGRTGRGIRLAIGRDPGTKPRPSSQSDGRIPRRVGSDRYDQPVLPLGAGISGDLLPRCRTAAAGGRIRRGYRQSTLGYGAGRCRIIRPTRSGSLGVWRHRSVHTRLGHLRSAIERAQ
jgi:hypothetical protein